MTLEEARTIWLTMLGSDWVRHYDIMVDPQYEGVLRLAYTELTLNAEIDVDRARGCVKIKCKS